MRLSLLLLVAALAVANAALLHSVLPERVIPGQYIVVLNSNVTVAKRDEHIAALLATSAANGARGPTAKVEFAYNIGSFIGFSAQLDQAMLKAELAHPDVDYIEEDQMMSLHTQVEAPDATVTQTGADWGLSRIDELTRSTTMNYIYDAVAGAGVDVFVIDTGVYTAHQEFAGGRATAVYNAITTESNQDLNGHGTHCAGTIGGTTYGVAKKVNIKGVKVLAGDGSGSNSGVIAGVNFVVNNRVANRPTVGSMSLGGGVSTTLDAAVDAVVKAGILMAVAAGNDNSNACNYSPARVASAVCVGAIAQGDTKASYSNFGTCLDIWAPGSNIKSAWIGGPTATNTISGTSMATPHVAGVMAIQLSRGNYNKALLLADATSNVVVSPGTGSVNKLLYSKF